MTAPPTRGGASVYSSAAEIFDFFRSRPKAIITILQEPHKISQKDPLTMYTDDILFLFSRFV